MSIVRVPAGADSGLVWHTGNPLKEQRLISKGIGILEFSNRDVLEITGNGRTSWAFLLPSVRQNSALLDEYVTYILDGNGAIASAVHQINMRSAVWAWTEHGAGQALATLIELSAEKAGMDLTVTLHPELSVVWTAEKQGIGLKSVTIRRSQVANGWEWFVQRGDVELTAAADELVGIWAYDAMRIAAGVPRFGIDTDANTTPTELGIAGAPPTTESLAWEVAGRPANTIRRLARLSIDGMGLELLPPAGTPVLYSGRQIGVFGTSAQHYELGPIGLAILESGIPREAKLTIGEAVALQEPNT